MGYVTELNKDNYDNFTKEGYVLIDIWATWCGPCKQIAPIVEQLSMDFVGKLSVGKLDATTNADTISELGVRNIPTLLLYKDGEIVERNVGMASKDKLTELIENHL